MMMEFNEIDVLRKQVEILATRLGAAEKENAKNYAMLTILAEAEAQKKKESPI